MFFIGNCTVERHHRLSSTFDDRMCCGAIDIMLDDGLGGP
jgi:hypothetical protein